MSPHHLSMMLVCVVALRALRVSPAPLAAGTHGQDYPQKHASEPGKHSAPLPGAVQQDYPQKHASEPGRDSDLPGGKERLFSGTHREEFPGEKDAQMSAEQQHKRKAPVFMVDLFNTVQQAGSPWGSQRQAGGLRPLRGSPRTPRSQKDLLKGNIVRSLQDKGSGSYHVFNLSSVGSEEKIIKAELRWFRTKQRSSHPKDQHFYKVDLYEVEGGGALPWQGKLISSRLLPRHSQGWEVFNVTLTVSTWLHDDRQNSGFLLVSSLHSDVQTERAPQSSVHSATRPQVAPENKNAYLVLFSDDTPTVDGGSPADDSAVKPSPATRRRSRRSAGDSPWLRPQRACRRAPLFVDFEEIGWGGWIISPRGYNAYSCEGACPFPLGESLRATNHATVRSIMHALRLTKPRGDGGDDDGGAPCCVPDKLQAISLLYFDEDENVVLKQYDDMVALSCGCQ